MILRIIHALGCVIVAVVSAATVGIAGWIAYLGFRAPPPYLEWLGSGAAGIGAAAILAIGTLLWATVTLVFASWTVQWLGRALVVLIRREAL